MGALTGIGSFAGGMARGAEVGMRLRDKIDARKEEKIRKEQEEEMLKAGKAVYEQDSVVSAPTIGMPEKKQDDSFGLNQFAGTDFTTPAALDDTTQVGQAYKNGGLVVRKYADGGLVEDLTTNANTVGAPMAADTKSLVGQVNQNAPQQQTAGLQPQQAPKENYGKKMSRSFNAMRDKAIELGRMDKATEYQNAGFQVRDRMFNEGLKGAQRAYQMTGDIKGFVDVYNDAIDDDANIEGYEKTPQGTYVLNINDGGNKIQREVGKAEIESMIMEFSDPAARYAMERQAMAKKNEAMFKTDEEIRKEKAKGVTLSAGQKHFSSDGKELYNPKDDSSLSETELAFKASKGDQDATKALNLIQSHKATIAREGRAPRAEREPSFERMAYDDWAREPENKGKGRNQYLREKAAWGKDDGTGYQTVNEKPMIDFDGRPVLDENKRPIIQRSVNRKEKIQPAKEKQAAKPFNTNDLFKKYGIK